MSISTFLRKSKTEKRTIVTKKLNNIYAFPIRFGKALFGNLFIAYKPDSFIKSSNYPEFNALFKKFTAHNPENAGDVPRLISFILNCRHVLDAGIEGDVAELGVWKGNTAATLAHYATAYNRTAYFLDTYKGFDSRDLQGIDTHKSIIFKDTSLDKVKTLVGTNENCVYIEGFFPESITHDLKSKRFSIVSLDCDLYEPMKAGLDFFYQRLNTGGIFFLHDYSSTRWPGAKKAINEFCISTGEYVVLIPDKSGSAFLRKTK